MGHQYSKCKKWEHLKNAPRWKVGRRVFHSLYNAEEFCSAHGLDVDQAIEHEDSEDFKQSVHEIALAQKAILKAMKERLNARKDELSKEIDMCVRNRDTGHPLEQNYWADRVNEAIAKHSECCDTLHLVFTINEELERLTDWHDY